MVATRRLEYRVIVGFVEKYYAWTGPREVNFNAPATLDSKLFRSSLLGGPPIITAQGSIIQGYGNPPFEWVQTRGLWFPRSFSKAFAAEVDVVFPVGDPIYSMALTFGGVTNQLGIEGEPLQIVQRGSAFGAAAGLKFEWGSNTGGGGTGTYRYEFNGSPLPLGNTPPRYIHWGYVHPVRKDMSLTPPESYAALGTVASPAQLMRVTRVRTEAFGDGYETWTPPAWTTANAGGTVDTANPRLGTPPLSERYDDDGLTWAILPRRYIRGVDFGGPNAEDMGQGKVVLTGLRGLFRDEPWENRVIIIDTRMHVKPSTYTAWRRQGVYNVGQPKISRRTIELPLRDRVLDNLNVPISQAFLGLDPDAEAVGEIDAVNRGYYLGDMINNCVEVADMVNGSPLSITDRNLNLPAILPLAVDTGGDSMLSFIYAVGDRLAQSTYTRFRRTGQGKYGELLMHLMREGDKAADWTFYGVGGASRSTIIRDSLELLPSDDGPGHLFYRQNNPLIDGQQSTTTGLPGIGRYPTGHYPTTAPDLSDSHALSAANVGMSPLFPFPDYAGVNKYGGVAKHRYVQENLARREITFKVRNIDFLEPGHYIAIDDPDGTGITTSERWIVYGLQHSIADGRLITTVYAHTATLVNALEKTMAA